MIQAPRPLAHSVSILHHDLSNYLGMTQVGLETPAHLQKLDCQGQGQRSLEFFVKVVGFLLDHRLCPSLDMKPVSGGIEAFQLKKPETAFSKQQDF